MDFFKKFFVIQALVTALNRLPPLRTFMMDLIYPEAVRRNHPFDRLSYSDLHLPSKNIPLVTRGSVSYAVTPDKSNMAFIREVKSKKGVAVKFWRIASFSFSRSGDLTVSVDGFIDGEAYAGGADPADEKRQPRSSSTRNLYKIIHKKTQ